MDVDSKPAGVVTRVWGGVLWEKIFSFSGRDLAQMTHVKKKAARNYSTGKPRQIGLTQNGRDLRGKSTVLGNGGKRFL